MVALVDAMTDIGKKIKTVWVSYSTIVNPVLIQTLKNVQKMRHKLANLVLRKDIIVKRVRRCPFQMVIMLALTHPTQLTALLNAEVYMDQLPHAKTVVVLVLPHALWLWTDFTWT